ncbi:NDR1/HIN1-like protein 3 [Typha angustifolia]|uniref:NDR1/HIN1-like protein 3 n=1 Tax=Typha angustifolia TaxID=59011 RepID=UPI003C309C5D
MADTKPSHLNGAYYGPPVPPQHSYHSMGRRSSCCGPCCLVSALFKLIFSIVVFFVIVIGIIVLVGWLLLRPNEFKVHVTSATLTQFNLSSANNLQYDLALDMDIRNPNKRIGIYYDYIETQAFYDGNRFGFGTLSPFYQGHKNTSTIHPEFNGTQLLLGDSVTTTYNREKSEGYYYVDVKVYTKLRLKIWIFKIHRNPKAKCNLKLPVPGNTNSTAAFEVTKCHIDYW